MPDEEQVSGDTGSRDATDGVRPPQRRAGGRIERHDLSGRVVTGDGVTSEHSYLLLPHSGTPERATVLVPWLDIEPDAVLPGRGRIADVLAELSADGVRRRDDLRLEW